MSNTIMQLLEEEIQLLNEFGTQFHGKQKNSGKEKILFTLLKRNHYNLRAVTILFNEYISNQAVKTSILSILRTILSDSISLIYLLDAFNDENEFLPRYDRLNASSIKKMKSSLSKFSKDDQEKYLSILKKEYPLHFINKTQAIMPGEIVNEVKNLKEYSNQFYALYDNISDIKHFNKIAIEFDALTMHRNILDGILFALRSDMLVLRCFSNGIESSKKVDEIACKFLDLIPYN